MTPRLQSMLKESQGRNSNKTLEAKTEAETREECLLLASSRGLLSLPSHTAKDHLTGVSSGLSPLTSIIKQTVPIDLHVGRSDGGIFSAEAPFFGLLWFVSW